ncbi:phage tail protein [Pasteurella bettyae]|uniref:Phage P2 GpU n=1 Tax=Pasteurella bettyae CCUG 2042 TaxID=1095749 RepID=I3D8L9_9PAST|nr:phage tail protein [Pasteurella bettyae]EIJ68062.1 phage P2 GpU [Pasteurella bettyae CCUG 2042]SUB22563.1 Phage protein U [Pasteurella bettyae]
MSNYALLGNIAFDLLSAPTGFDESRSAVFAEHEVLSGKPKLQAMGMALTDVTLQLQLHHQLAPVENRYQALLTAQESQEALALVFGFSKFKGHFVITDVTSTVLFTDGKGNALARDVSLTLREFVGNPQAGILGAALSLADNSPLASIVPKGLSNFVSQANQLMSKGIAVARQVKQVVADVKSAVEIMKHLKDNPLAALSEISGIVNTLGGSFGGLAEMVGLGNAFASLTEGVRGAAGFMQDLTTLSGHLNTAYSLFKSGIEGDELGEWFDLGVKAIESADLVSESLAKNSAKMTAWIAIRADSGEDNDE